MHLRPVAGASQEWESIATGWRPMARLAGLHVWEELDQVLTHIDISYEIFINKCSLCLCPTGLPTLFFLSATILYEIDYCAPGKWDWVRTLTIHYIALLSYCIARNSNLSGVSCHANCFIAISWDWPVSYAQYSYQAAWFPCQQFWLAVIGN